MSDSISSISAFAQSRADLYFLNTTLVTILTWTSVHWADKIVAIKSSSGFVNFSAVLACGYVSFNIGQILLTRRAASSFLTFILFFFAAIDIQFLVRQSFQKLLQLCTYHKPVQFYRLFSARYE